MTAIISSPSTSLPDHTQLPDKDGTFVKNFQEFPQSILLTESIWLHLQNLHPDGQFSIGQDSGIYWRITEPPERGAEAPDWFYVPHVSPTIRGEMRRSYVMWQEIVAPLIAIEFVSGNGNEERDITPYKGKFWIYERAIRIPFYGIYEVKKSQIEMYELVRGEYVQMSMNERGHYEIPPMEVELGIWQGVYKNVNLPWLRWWDKAGNLLLTGEEELEQEREKTALAQALLEQERQAKELAQGIAEQERQAKELAQRELAEMAAQLARYRE